MKKVILIIILTFGILSSAVASVDAQVVSNSAHCKTLGFSKIHKVGWTEWLGSANPRARSDADNDFWTPKYTESGLSPELDNMHKVADPDGSNQDVFRVTHREGHNYGVVNKIRSLHEANDEANEMCLAYKVFWPENFYFGDSSNGKYGSKVLGIAGTDQNHDYENIWGCISKDKITAFSYRLHLDKDGQIDNYLYHRGKSSSCGDRFGTGYSVANRKGEWVQIEQYVYIGKGSDTGRFELWIDGDIEYPKNDSEKAKASGFDFGGTRDAYAGGITMSAFFGGQGPGSYSIKDEYTYYKDVEMHFGNRNTPANQVELVSTKQRVHDVLQIVAKGTADAMRARGKETEWPIALTPEDVELYDEDTGGNNGNQGNSLDVAPNGGDGKIDFQDFLVVRSGFAQALNTLDFDNNGVVNIHDFSLLISGILE